MCHETQLPRRTWVPEHAGLSLTGATQRGDLGDLRPEQPGLGLWWPSIPELQGSRGRHTLIHPPVSWTFPLSSTASGWTLDLWNREEKDLLGEEQRAPLTCSLGHMV